MKLVYMVVVLSLSILMSGCTVINVDYDYDAGFDFSNLSRYSWLEMPVDFRVDNFSIQRVKTAIDQQMKEKGFSLTTGPDDFLLSLQGYKDTVRQSSQHTSAPRVTGGRSANEQYQHGMFTLTIIDTKTDRRIWQGHAKGVVAPHLSTEDRVKKTNEIVAKLLTNFPPSNK